MWLGRCLFLCGRNPPLQTHQMFLSPCQAQSEEFKVQKGTDKQEPPLALGRQECQQVAASTKIGKLPRALRRGPHRVPSEGLLSLQLHHRWGGGGRLSWPGQGTQLVWGVSAQKGLYSTDSGFPCHALFLLGIISNPYFGLVEMSE